jgi:YHS domain-containing protein
MILLLLPLLTACSGEQESEVFTEGGFALAGMDPVSYFKDGGPKKGVAAHESSLHGVRYRFANAENLESFASNPEAYLPKYGGFCAYAVADARKKVAPHVNTWMIQDGKLLLFYDNAELQGKFKKIWIEDSAQYTRKADQNWQEMTATADE